MMREYYKLIFILLLLALNPGCRAGDVPVYKETRLLMGTTVEIIVAGRDQEKLRRGVDASYREMSRLSDMMNHYAADSVVSEINRQAGRRPVTVPPELMQVLIQARRVSEKSGGAFDITVGALTGWRFDPDHPAMPPAKKIAAELPLVNYRNLILHETKNQAFLKRRGMRIDLGGIAKLFILHAGMQVMQRHGIRQAMINGGGDIEVIGGFRGRPWRVGIRDPRDQDNLLATLELHNGFVVSSGDYERYFIKDGRRYHHILDPATGYPATGARHVTLVAGDLNQVNGMATSIVVRGLSWGRNLINRTAGLEGLIVGRDGELWISNGIKSDLTCIQAYCKTAMRPAG